ncbi:capsid protein [Pseudoxanthomonas sp. SE1]|nr:capsid protein [Pseudoxanthomonas sp. SE1]WFC43782.1 capsid protein [Pseudoxanthomonas sp. SE1]
MNFDSIISTINALGPAAAILGAAALVVLGSFVQWLAPKVARFFVMRGR